MSTSHDPPEAPAEATSTVDEPVVVVPEVAQPAVAEAEVAAGTEITSTEAVEPAVEAAQAEPEPEPAKPDGPLAIHHIGVAVGSIDEAMHFYGDKLGLEIADRIDMPERSLKVAFVRTGNTLIELLQPTNTESTVARFIERRGPGLHHLCFGTPDIAEHLRDLKDKDVELIDEQPRPGAHGDVAFLAPAAAYGVLVELLQELPPEKLAARDDPRPY